MDSFLGNIIWSYTADRGIHSGPVIYNDLVFFGIWKYLYALDVYSGKEKWKFQISGTDETYIHATNGVVFCAASDLYAISIKTGAELWRFETTDWGITSVPSSENGIVYFGSFDGYLLGIDIPSGEVEWKYYAASPISSSIVSNGILFFWSSGRVSGTKIYASHNDIGYLKAIDIKTEEILWEFECNYRVNPIKYGDIIFFGTEREFYAIETKEKRLMWKKDINFFYGPPFIHENLIYFGDRNSIQSYNIETGIPSTKFSVPKGAIAPKILNDRIFYKEVGSGLLIEIDLISRKRINTFKMNPFLDFEVFDNMLLYGKDETFYALE